MRSDLTDVTVVIDRSGSMDSCRTDAEGGLNSFIGEQAKLPGECLVSLVQFDTVYEWVHKAVPAIEVPKYSLHPRGGTALLDAVGQAINETGERLASMPEDQRPGLVAIVIVTDGQENSSREFQRAQIKEMIERQQNDYQWQFTFLGANQDAFAEAGSIGIRGMDAATYSTAKSGEAFNALGGKLGRMRSQVATGQAADSAYTKEELTSMS